MFEPLLQTPPWYWAVLGALAGGILASFSMVVIERIPKGVSINGRSRCGCGRPLKARENLPLLGWLLSGGKAACCGTRIPVRLFLAEAAAALLGAGIGWTGAQELGYALLGWFVVLTAWAVPTALTVRKSKQQ